MDLILVAVVSLGVIGLIAAVILYVASKKFAVYEDPRIAQVSEVLPQANCGGCGYPGCSGFAGACVKAADAGSLEGKLCPVGGAPVMAKVASILGLEAVASEPKVAVVRCNGSCENRPRITKYDGALSCAIANTTCGGETACAFGCLGCGDCVSVCKFDAIHMNPETGLPEVDEDKCTACGACSKACPRHIIEIRPKGKNNRRMVVMCVNKDKGPVANKACSASCIGCGKCVKVCPFEAITLENNLAYIDPTKCKSCRKCEQECPKGAIHAINFPARKPKPVAPKPAAGAAAPAAGAAATPRPAAARPAAPAAGAAAPAAKPAEAPKAPATDAPKAAPAAPAPVETPKAAPTTEAPKAAPAPEAKPVEAPKAPAAEQPAPAATEKKEEAPSKEA